MSVGKAKLSKRKKILICQLNDLCFGMHGHLSALLKDLKYFFYFKKKENDTFSDLYLQRLFFHLKHIIVLTRLIEDLGGYAKMLEYKNNQVDYHALKGKDAVVEKVAILDGIATQTYILKNYFIIKENISDEKVSIIIDNEIQNIKNEMDLLIDKFVTKGVKTLNN